MSQRCLSMETSMDKLLIYLKSLSALSSESWKLLQPALTRRRFGKKEYLSRQGEVCNRLFYVENGYCRSCIVVEGLERNTGFFFENEIVTDLDSFGKGEASGIDIIACDPTETIVFDKEKLFVAAHASPEIEALGRNCIREFASRQEEFSRLLRLYSPEDRVSYLERYHPYMLQRIPLTQLASFLGITRESLSRIRRRRMRP